MKWLKSKTIHVIISAALTVGLIQFGVPPQVSAVVVKAADAIIDVMLNPPAEEVQVDK